MQEEALLQDNIGLVENVYESNFKSRSGEVNTEIMRVINTLLTVSDTKTYSKSSKIKKKFSSLNLVSKKGNLVDEKNKIVFHTYALNVSLAGFWTVCFFNDLIYFEAIYLVSATTSILLLFNPSIKASLSFADLIAGFHLIIVP